MCVVAPWADRLKTQEDLQEKTDIPFWRWSGQRCSLLLTEGSDFLFYSGLQLIGWDPPTLGRAACFTEFTDSDVNLSRNILTDTLRIMFHQTSGPPMAHQVDIQN